MMEEMGNASESAGGILINAPSTGDSFGVRLTDRWLMELRFAVQKPSRSGRSSLELPQKSADREKYFAQPPKTCRDLSVIHRGVAVKAKRVTPEA